jgi:hypothetical protein
MRDVIWERVLLKSWDFWNAEVELIERMKKRRERTAEFNLFVKELESCSGTEVESRGGRDKRTSGHGSGFSSRRFSCKYSELQNTY